MTELNETHFTNILLLERDTNMVQILDS